MISYYEHRLLTFYGSTHFTRKIGIISQDIDSIRKWQCPDCHKEQNRKSSFKKRLSN